MTYELTACTCGALIPDTDSVCGCCGKERHQAAILAYAEHQIEVLNLGHGGPLGTEFVCAYDDETGEVAVRVSDGRGQEICRTREEVDAALQAWVDWIAE